MGNQPPRCKQILAAEACGMSDASFPVCSYEYEIELVIAADPSNRSLRLSGKGQPYLQEPSGVTQTGKRGCPDGDASLRQPVVGHNLVRQPGCVYKLAQGVTGRLPVLQFKGPTRTRCYCSKWTNKEYAF